MSDTELKPLLPSLALFSVTSQVLFQNELDFSLSLIFMGRLVVFYLFLHSQCSHILIRIIFIEYRIQALPSSLCVIPVYLSSSLVHLNLLEICVNCVAYPSRMEVPVLIHLRFGLYYAIIYYHQR